MKASRNVKTRPRNRSDMLQEGNVTMYRCNVLVVAIQKDTQGSVLVVHQA